MPSIYRPAASITASYIAPREQTQPVTEPLYITELTTLLVSANLANKGGASQRRALLADGIRVSELTLASGRTTGTQAALLHADVVFHLACKARVDGARRSSYTERRDGV